MGVNDEECNDGVDRLDAMAPAQGGIEALDALAGLEALDPPPTIRDDVLARAGASPRAHVEPTSPAELFAAQVAMMHALLDELQPSEWDMVAEPYAWTVHGLVAHLLVVERYTADVLGVERYPEQLAGGVHDHLAMGADVIETELLRAPEDTAVDWAWLAARNAAFAADALPDDDDPAPLHGWPFTRSSALVARAFEVWTHADDIRRATGRALSAPTAGELRTMSSLSVGSLPLLVGKSMRPARVVLTGPGGGTFDIGGTGERAALLATDVVDYCRVVARRIAPAELTATRQGDTVLIDTLLTAATAFAV